MGSATEKSLDATQAVAVSRSDDTAQQQGRDSSSVGNPRDGQRSWSSKIFNLLSFVPSNCRYDPEKPFKFSMRLNILFGERIFPLEGEQFIDNW
jgi:hypothetical protein